jgi:hypothetical protein
MNRLVLAITATFALACTDREEAAALEVAAAQVDTRDQYALVQEIIDARSRQPPELATALDTVRHAWQHRRYRWEVAIVPTLCRAATSCVAMPFDHLRHPDLQIVQGWLPRLELDADAHAKLLRDCEPHKQCVLTFEGDLDRFVLDPEDPTSLAFANVEIQSVRAAEPSESWIRRARNHRALSGNPKVVGARTTLRSEQG